MGGIAGLALLAWAVVFFRKQESQKADLAAAAAQHPHSSTSGASLLKPFEPLPSAMSAPGGPEREADVEPGLDVGQPPAPVAALPPAAAAYIPPAAQAPALVQPTPPAPSPAPAQPAAPPPVIEQMPRAPPPAGALAWTPGPAAQGGATTIVFAPDGGGSLRTMNSRNRSGRSGNPSAGGAGQV